MVLDGREMMRQTALKRRTRLNPMSIRRIAQLNAEVNTRVALCQRAGGSPSLLRWEIRGMTLWTVICRWGTCEICHQKAETLEPHEKLHRSLGGKVSLENSVEVCRRCHRKEHP